MSSKKRSLDLYLGEVLKQFIAIKDEDFKKSQEVFKSVFEQVKQKIGEQCNYFQKYCKQDMYAGSVYDGIKVSKMDEFDMDIVVRLPINYADITIENKQPGFVKLKITNAFDNLDKQQDWEKCHKVTREWRDSDKYLLQNKFRQWFHGIVQKALNAMDGKVTVCGFVYLLTYKESGPSYTLQIRNDTGSKEFILDVDLVPVIKFMYPRTPDGYRVIDGIQAKDWLVVPKPNKEFDEKTKNQCWRLSFQEQEREVIKGCLALKSTIRMVKKLRDALGMNKIASYYIKSLFLKKVMETKDDKTYWQNKLSFLFRVMVVELRDAIKKKNIPYFWNSGYNLIGALKDSHQKIYTEKLNNVIAAIDANDVDKVVGALLTSEELKEFKKSDVYQRYELSSQSSTSDSSVVDAPAPSITTHLKTVAAEMNNLPENYQKDKKFAALEMKLNDLADRMTSVEERLEKLERMKNNKDTVIEVVTGTSLLDLADTDASYLPDSPSIIGDTQETCLLTI